MNYPDGAMNDNSAPFNERINRFEDADLRIFRIEAHETCPICDAEIWLESDHEECSMCSYYAEFKD